MTARGISSPPRPWSGGPPSRRAGKRLFDVLAALCALVVLLPLLLLVGLLVRLTSPGNALFRQVRLGRDGRPFVLYKYRTMYDGCPDEVHRAYVSQLLTADAPQAGLDGMYKLDADPRITRIGAVLRRTSLDELPQLLNVIRGDMSLVGPRPVLAWEAEMFSQVHRQRFLVRPGLTGLWQVSGRCNLTMRQALDLDVEYVERQSFALDLSIILKTVPAVLSASGAR
jgi:lipopolysaccharide/colanic/teichoic acid biosynthesis glycosyltransferase